MVRIYFDLQPSPTQKTRTIDDSVEGTHVQGKVLL